MDENLKAFLTMIAVSELGQGLIKVSDNGYNVIVGSTVAKPNLFATYNDHPRVLVDLGKGLKSTAAGRYQILEKYFDVYKVQLRLPDFGPESQDKIACQMLRECRVLDDIEAGRVEAAVTKAKSRWASLPGAGYGQHENSMTQLIAAYSQAGGKVA